MFKFRILFSAFFLLTFLFFTDTLFAQLLTEEFSYTTGQALTANGWTAYDASGSNPVLVASGSLSYTNYPSSGTGNSTNVIGTSGSREDVKKTFNSQTSGSVYASFLVNFSSATTATDGDYFFGFFTSIGVIMKGKVFVKKSGSNIAFGVSKGATLLANISYSAFSYSLSTTYLLVLKYTFNASSNDDVINLFINPDLSGSEPSPDLTNTDTPTDLANVGAVALRQGSKSYNVIIDGIRVATSWSLAPLPVELTSFNAIPKENSVVLFWNTATEINNYGFQVQRKNDKEKRWNDIGFVPGHGNSNTPQDYTFVDKNPVGATTFYYRLKQIDVDGKFEYSDILQVRLDVPNKVELMQNSPNPFNPSTSIKFFIPNDADITIKIYDLNGREVRTLMQEKTSAGFHIVFWNGRNSRGEFASSGVYFYRLSVIVGSGSAISGTANFVQTKKMILIK
ncbi:MAG: T9SS type A sorting domain-containing protein [Bacteroidetes bacterium]|nr:T9SS type A sorting domain-containing protein [Bacteroidota bacterium]